MKHKDLYTMLKNVGIPVAYDHFETKQNVTPPFMAYREIAPVTFKADGITYHQFSNFQIEVVTEKKDVELETKIEGVLTQNKIPYDKDDEVWDEDERVYHVYYEI